MGYAAAPRVAFTVYGIQTFFTAIIILIIIIIIKELKPELKRFIYIIIIIIIMMIINLCKHSFLSSIAFQICHCFWCY